MISSSDKLKLEEFILKAVQANAKITVEGSGPVARPLTVQALLNDLNLESLERFYDFLKKLPASTGSSRRGTQKNWYVKDIVTADELADIIDIILALREGQAKAAKNKARERELEAKIAALATPEELKQSLKQELAELQRSV